MKVTVFGATGGTGKQVVEQALAAGHEVTALVRNPAVVPERDGLRVVQGDVLDLAAVEAAVTGSDVIVSAVGVSDRKPTKVYSEGVGNMLRAMKAEGQRRIIVVSADGVEPNPNVNIGQRLVMALVVARIFRHQWTDMLTMEHDLEAADVDWTILRPPRLNDGERTGTYRTSPNEPMKDSSNISRSDLADFIVTHLADEASYRRLVWISY